MVWSWWMWARDPGGYTEAQILPCLEVSNRGSPEHVHPRTLALDRLPDRSDAASDQGSEVVVAVVAVVVAVVVSMSS